MGAAYQRLLARLEQTRPLGVSLGLERMQRALVALGSPERSLRAVHVAGTNGKGSTAAMTEAILRAAGLRTGLYTSPHLSRFTERIQIDGQEISGDALAALDERVVATGIELTYFEVATVLAFLALAEAAVDVGILEVGLGGRLDSTNVCHPVATAITSIGLDHTDLLGDSLAAIAREKAGIAKRGVPLFVGHLPGEADREVARIAARVGAPLHRLGVDVPPVPFPPALPGRHQQANAALAGALAREAARACGHGLSERAVARGLASVVWPGRLERVAPDLWLDAAHNLEGVEALTAALPRRRPLAAVISIVHGKPATEMLAVLAPRFDSVWLTRSRNARAMPPEQLAALLPANAPAPVSEPDPLAAVQRARAAVAPDGAVVVCGSIFLAGEIRAHILGEPVDPVGGGDPMPIPRT
jgi:dihydrofolate synthase/folylpolyglutamate synthase